MKRNITVLISIFIALLVSFSTTYVMTAQGGSDGSFNSNDNNGDDDKFNRNHNQNQNVNDNQNGNNNRPARVESHRLKCKKKRPTDCNCKRRNIFKIRRGHDVYVEGDHLPSLSHVDIYVIQNRKWKLGDPIGTDVRSSGVQTVATDHRGKIVDERGEDDCAIKIWDDPPAPGKFDIVVDVNQDGTFNLGDAIDGIKKRPGFRVK